MAAGRQGATDYYSREWLLELILVAKAKPKWKPSNHYVPPYSVPIPSPHDPLSFCEMFNEWMVDSFRFQARPGEPDPTMTELVAGDRSSERIVEYSDGSTGILKSDCFGRTYLVHLPLKHNGSLLKENLKDRELSKMLREDYEHRREKLRAWWEDPENAQDAWNIQHHYKFELYCLLDSIHANLISAQGSINLASCQGSITALGRQWETLLQGLKKWYEKDKMLSTLPADPGSPSLGTATVGPRGGSDLPCTYSVKPTKPYRMSFAELADTFRFNYGLQLLWDKDRNHVPFHFEAKVLLLDFPEPGSSRQPLDRVMHPKWHFDDIRVPLDCDWPTLRKHLEAAFPADNDACDSYEKFVGGVLANNLVNIDRETLRQKFELSLKSIKKPVSSDLSGWWYSNLANIRSPNEIFHKAYGNCETEKGFRNLMELVKARNALVLARATTVCCLRSVTRIANGDNRWRGDTGESLNSEPAFSHGGTEEGRPAPGSDTEDLR